MGQFKPKDKMETTEPSVELKLKKGGQAHKKHMADGGVPMSAPRITPAMASRARMMARPRMAMPVAEPAVMPTRPMKKGGKTEGGKSDMAQDKAMIKKAFKQHDAQEHKGAKGTNLKLKKGGKMHRMAMGGGVADAGPDVPGGLLGGISPTKAVSGATTGVRAPGYKAGGHIKHSAMSKGGSCGHMPMKKGGSC